jgi:membrane protease YdiL (CAAX protease family)
MSYGEAFQILKARYCIAAIIIAWYWQPGSQVFAVTLASSEWYWPDLVFHYYAHGTMALFLILAVLVTRLEVSGLIGRRLVRQDFRPILFIVILTYCASSAIVTFTFVPMSYLFPDFVTWWLTWFFQPVVYLTADGALPTGANIISFFSLVVLAPVLEECIFRGYLLHRWSMKWGLWTGVLLSSAAFGTVHPDTLAAAVTGLGFAVLYLKTQTLWAPIIAHSIFNFVSWLWDFYGVTSKGADYYTYTIDQLRGDWWYGAIALFIVVLLIDRILRRNTPLGPFILPLPGGLNGRRHR